MQFVTRTKRYLKFFFRLAFAVKMFTIQYLKLYAVFGASVTFRNHLPFSTVLHYFPFSLKNKELETLSMQRFRGNSLTSDSMSVLPSPIPFFSVFFFRMSCNNFPRSFSSLIFIHRYMDSNTFPSYILYYLHINVAMTVGFFSSLLLLSLPFRNPI